MGDEVTRAEYYLTHYIRESCGWIKIAEYAFNSAAQRDAARAEIIARYPNDDYRFEERAANV